MNRKKMIGWLIISVVAAFGIASANAQTTAGKRLKAWKISYYQAGGKMATQGIGYTLDDEGILEERQGAEKTTRKIDDTDLQEIVKLLEELDLSLAKTKTVKGKNIYDYPYWNLTIEFEGKSYLMEGMTYSDTDFIALTAEPKAAFEKLKAKLLEIRRNRQRKTEFRKAKQKSSKGKYEQI